MCQSEHIVSTRTMVRRWSLQSHTTEEPSRLRSVRLLRLFLAMFNLVIGFSFDAPVTLIQLPVIEAWVDNNYFSSLSDFGLHWRINVSREITKLISDLFGSLCRVIHYLILVHTHFISAPYLSTSRTKRLRSLHNICLAKRLKDPEGKLINCSRLINSIVFNSGSIHISNM